MQQKNEVLLLTNIHRMLYELGIKPADPDMFCTAYAILAAYCKPELLQDIPGSLYPAVAEHYGLEPDEVAHSLACIIDQIYRTHTTALSALLGQPVNHAPQADTFLSAAIAQL